MIPFELFLAGSCLVATWLAVYIVRELLADAVPPAPAGQSNAATVVTIVLLTVLMGVGSVFAAVDGDLLVTANALAWCLALNALWAWHLTARRKAAGLPGADLDASARPDDARPV